MVVCAVTPGGLFGEAVAVDGRALEAGGGDVLLYANSAEAARLRVSRGNGYRGGDSTAESAIIAEGKHSIPMQRSASTPNWNHGVYSNR